ncbi:MAG: ferredoxin--NADP reductase, partial [Rugosibacter sp.]|nr:ferredoxin--NADP reductase [Rugosibacter sp.]
MADTPFDLSSIPDKKISLLATERWENEGGATCTGHTSHMANTLSKSSVLATESAPATERFTDEAILALRYWTPGLLSFRTSRASDFRFTPGHYARLGLSNTNDGVVWRPFSVASTIHDSHLEFFAVLVPGGPFSRLLANIRLGDTIRVDKASYGFMTIAQLAPGKDLWLLASGTGLGPFLSILRDPATWQAYENLVLVHSVRYADELAYRDEIATISHEQQLAALPTKMQYVPVVTRGSWPGALAARIPQLLENGRLEQAAEVKLDPQR